MSWSGALLVSYLEVALDAAERGQWETVKLNATEAAKYAEITERLEKVAYEENAEGRGGAA